MHSVYKDLFCRTAYLEEISLQHGFYMSMCRSILQLCATTAIELCCNFGDDEDQEELCDLAKRMLAPPDGVFFEALDKAIFILRGLGWANCVPTWYDIPSGTSQEKPLRILIRDLIEARNDRPAHGVISNDSIVATLEWLPITTDRLINELTDLLPSKTSPYILYSPLGQQITIKSIVNINGKAIIVRKYKKSGSSWRAQYQILDPHESKSGYFDVRDDSPIINTAFISKKTLRSSTIHLKDSIWNPSFKIPNRQTETFEGRRNEIHELLEWWNDEDSRACLVYGEGGIGKTTLVLEFLNDLLESSYLDIKWKPQLIFFYTAKETRWGVNGLEHLPGVAKGLAESIRQLVSTLDDSMGKDWFSENPNQLIDKAATFLADFSLSRKDILIVIDNSETLAKTPSEVDVLAKTFRQMSSKLGRILITSRRREKIEAFPIQVLQLDTEAGAALLNRLGEAYDAKPLISAGKATLASVSRTLSGKPLLLDVLARHIGNSGCGIEHGVQFVLGQGRSDLGEFLYEDAWGRMQSRNKKIFLIIGQYGSSVPDQLVSWSCAEVGVQIDDWMESFNETKFGTMNDYGSNFEIIFDANAREYLSKKYSELDENKKASVDQVVKKTRNKYQQLLRASDSGISDRVANAFRTSAAKAAKIAANLGKYDDAIMWFEEAISNDPANYALLDRFALFLMKKGGDPERAYSIAKRACQVGPDDADAHFTAGMIAARAGNVSDARNFFESSVRFGKESYLCAIQMARAKINSAIKQNVADKVSILDEALRDLYDIEIPRSCYYQKNIEEVNRLVGQCKFLIEQHKIKNRRIQTEIIYLNK